MSKIGRNCSRLISQNVLTAICNRLEQLSVFDMYIEYICRLLFMFETQLPLEICLCIYKFH